MNLLPKFGMARFFAVLVVVLSCWPAGGGGALVRDLVTIAGARDNQLVGYGLVVGLAGDGDRDPAYTQQTLANILQRYGVNLLASTISSKNVAVVLVTADIPAFAAADKAPAIQFIGRLHEAGLLAIPAGARIVRVLPALNLPREEAAEGVRIIESVAAKLSP